MIVRVAGPGSMLGLYAVLSHGVYEVSSESLTEAQLRPVERERFLGFLRSHKEAQMRAVQCICQEYRFALQDACRIALAETVAARLGRLLLELANQIGEHLDSGDFRFPLLLTHEEMASMACTTRETVTRFRRRAIRAYYASVYAPSNLTVTAAGNLKHDRLVALVREHFETLAPRAAAPPDSVPNTHARIVLRHKKALEQVHLCLGVPSYPMPHQQRFACYVLNTLLGGGMSSRLFQNIRERQGLAYAVFSELSPYRDTGCLSVYAGTSIESARKVVRAVTGEFRLLKEEPVGEEELRRAKDHLKGSLMLGLESTGSRMSNLARQEMYFGRFFSLDELVESIEAVSAGEIQKIARTFFDGRQIALTVLGNLDHFKIGREDLVC